jgi:hypothetical protein
MKRTAMMMALAMLVSAGVTRAAAQESVAATPTSPVQGGKVMKAKTMTAVGAVKSVAADSLEINDGPGKDWTFVIDASTKIIPRKETVEVTPASPVQGGKVMPTTPGTGQEAVDVTPASPIQGGKVIPSKRPAITDIKEGQRVRVTYHTVDGKMHATQVRVM